MKSDFPGSREVTFLLLRWKKGIIGYAPLSIGLQGASITALTDPRLDGMQHRLLFTGFAVHYETNPYLPESKRKYLLGNESYIHMLVDQEYRLSNDITDKKRHTKNAVFTIEFHH